MGLGTRQPSTVAIILAGRPGGGPVRDWPVRRANARCAVAGMPSQSLRDPCGTGQRYARLGWVKLAVAASVVISGAIVAVPGAWAPLLAR